MANRSATGPSAADPGPVMRGLIWPDVIACADWSCRPHKRRVAVARKCSTGRYLVDAPAAVGDPQTLILRLQADRLLLGLDLPIGVPSAWARRAGVTDFKTLLPSLGHGRFARFFEPADRPDEVRIERPFYPHRAGGARRADLIDGLGLGSAQDLHRLCDHRHAGRPDGAALFWTLGPNQVGKAAITAWRDLLQPAVNSGTAAIWPFEGDLCDLIRTRPTTIVEIYPPEHQARLGLRLGRSGQGSKRRAADRADAAPALFRAAERLGLDLMPTLSRTIAEGFKGADGEDRFDSLIGLLGMVRTLRGDAPTNVPDRPEIVVEGWILGRPHEPEIG